MVTHILSFPDRLKLEGANVINMDISTNNGVIQVVETIVEVPRREEGRRPRSSSRGAR